MRSSHALVVAGPWTADVYPAANMHGCGASRAVLEVVFHRRCDLALWRFVCARAAAAAAKPVREHVYASSAAAMRQRL